jgi:acetyl-CoA/propionyl-CoA carboxylase carboxyl transferase subunit
MTTIAHPSRLDVIGDRADPRCPKARLEALFDPGSCRFRENPGLLEDPDETGALTAEGQLHGVPTVAYCTDPRILGGALGHDGCHRIAGAIDAAVARRTPVVGLWHSGGARLGDGVASLEGVGTVFTAIVGASGRVPQVSVILGPAAGGGAYGPALTDVIVMSEQARLFVTGPDVVRSVTGEDVDMDGLGGPAVHGRLSGVAHLVAVDEAAAIRSAAAVTALLACTRRPDPARVGARPELARALPEGERRAYDVRPLLAGLLDTPAMELQARWAPNIVTQLGVLGGATVGVLANNPQRLGGCLTAEASDKAARFVRMCDALGVPLVVVVDVPGYLPGIAQEHGGVLRRGAKLLHAFAEATVPRVTLVTRKAYGGAYLAMNARSLGASAVFAWPGAHIAVMGVEAAVDILHRRRLAGAGEADLPRLRAQLIAEHQRRLGDLSQLVAAGTIDAVIDPVATPRVLASALAGAQPGQRRHSNIPL